MRGGNASLCKTVLKASFRRLLKCFSSITISAGSTSPFVLEELPFPFPVLACLTFGAEAEAADGLEGEALAEGGGLLPEAGAL